MNRFKSSTTVAGIVSIFVATLLFYPMTGAAEECYVVKVFGIGSPVSLRLDPDIISISKGNCVVWINWGREIEVTVKFKEGKRCAEATKAPVGFRMDAMNCYLAERIPLGGTASLMFNEEGTFDYEVGTPFASVRGTIIVRK